MFGKWKRQAIRYKELFDQLTKDYAALFNERHDVARLSGIRREGRVNIFTFVRNGEEFTIETMGMLSDAIPEWKIKAGLYKPEQSEGNA